MKTVFVLLFGLAHVSNIFAACPAGFAPYQDRCYAALRVQVTWAEALRVCQAMGSKLATINSAEEQHFIEQYISGLNGTIPTSEIWIAATDILFEGIWRWADTGETLDEYTNWAPGEPDNIGGTHGNAHCLGLFRDAKLLWDDDNCELKMIPLCSHTVNDADGLVG